MTDESTTRYRLVLTMPNGDEDYRRLKPITAHVAAEFWRDRVGEDGVTARVQRQVTLPWEDVDDR